MAIAVSIGGTQLGRGAFKGLVPSDLDDHDSRSALQLGTITLPEPSLVKVSATLHSINPPLQSAKSNRLNIDGDRKLGKATADKDSVDWCDIRIVSSPSNGDMFNAWNDIVGWVEVDPAQPSSVRADPGMGSVGTDEFLFAWCGVR